ncbi:OprO/OprP family phosphate-selective porin, partial [bacterium]|nr:OprO/OprP family phosphate-selective porin [bacterium]
MSFRAVIFSFILAGAFTLSFADPPTVTYRLESSGVFTGPEHGNLYPEYYFNDDNWEETYLQELRVFMKGKASPQVGYRIEPRFQYTYADSSGEFDWTLDQAYTYVDFSDRVSVTSGKQRIRWGTGMTFTPTDRWQPSTNTLDPMRYLEGIFLFRADAYLPFASLTAVYTPSRENVEYSFNPHQVAGLRLYKLIGTLDIYFSATRSFDSYRGMSMSGSFIPDDRTETNYGAAFSWDSGPAVIYGEASHLKLTTGTIRHLLDPDVNDWQQRFVLGASKQFNSSSSGYIEAYYNGWGLNHLDYKQLIKIIEQLQGFYGPYIENTPFADYV